jgi:glycopeptide antibiotics resistance protein
MARSHRLKIPVSSVPRTAPAVYLAVVWILVIVALVVPWQSLQNHTHWARIRWVPFVSAPVNIGDIIRNVLLYVPFGYIVASRSSSWPLCVGGAAALSWITEFTQIWSHGRFPSVQDVFMNIAGAAIGTLIRRLREPGQRGSH